MKPAATLVALLLLGAAPPAAHPVAVELFTSQGCSSCPPADALAQRLARDPSLVMLSRPVTYWDQLGWRDTLARPDNTLLQQAYVRHGFAGGNPFTPEVVVAGRAAAVGADAARIARLTASAANLPAPTLSVAGNRRFVTIDGSTSTPGELVLVALRPSVTVAIGRGENSGRSVTYTNVVTAERVLGKWSGGAGRFALPTLTDAPRHALLLRVPYGGPVLAARYL